MSVVKLFGPTDRRVLRWVHIRLTKPIGRLIDSNDIRLITCMSWTAVSLIGESGDRQLLLMPPSE